MTDARTPTLSPETIATDLLDEQTIVIRDDGRRIIGDEQTIAAMPRLQPMALGSWAWIPNANSLTGRGRST